MPRWSLSHLDRQHVFVGTRGSPADEMSALRVRTVLRHARGCWRFVGSGWVVCTRGNIFTRCAWRQPGVTVRSADQPRVRSFVFNTARAHHSRAPV